MTILNLFPLLIIIPLMAIATFTYHLLLTLLFMEFLTLNTLSIIILSISMSTSMEPLYTLLLLTLGACEATLGLSCLVKMTRSFGSDNMNLMSLMSL